MIYVLLVIKAWVVVVVVAWWWWGSRRGDGMGVEDGGSEGVGGRPYYLPITCRCVGSSTSTTTFGCRCRCRSTSGSGGGSRWLLLLVTDKAADDLPRHGKTPAHPTWSLLPLLVPLLQLP